MGKAMTFAIGQINHNRRVRVKTHDGGGHTFGTLVGSVASHALVKPDNYSGPPKQVPWTDVYDWTSRNPGPLKLPPPEPAPTPAIASKLQPKVIPVPAQPPNPFDVFGQISSQMPKAIAEIDAAEEEIDAATEMLQQAQARHAEAVKKLADLRKQIATATADIDSRLIGTSAHSNN